MSCKRQQTGIELNTKDDIKYTTTHAESQEDSSFPADDHQSHHTRQMVTNPTQTRPKAHLQPIPAFDEPFGRLIIVCVGPCPKQSQYLRMF